jgi:fructoselysine-6-P-deglycase FrlB-like protein
LGSSFTGSSFFIGSSTGAASLALTSSSTSGTALAATGAVTLLFGTEKSVAYFFSSLLAVVSCTYGFLAAAAGFTISFFLISDLINGSFFTGRRITGACFG